MTENSSFPCSFGYGSKIPGTSKSLLVKGKIDPATCGPRLGFLFDPCSFTQNGSMSFKREADPSWFQHHS